jgi:hypothetical protein
VSALQGWADAEVAAGRQHFTIAHVEMGDSLDTVVDAVRLAAANPMIDAVCLSKPFPGGAATLASVIRRDK